MQHNYITRVSQIQVTHKTFLLSQTIDKARCPLGLPEGQQMQVPVQRANGFNIDTGYTGTHTHTHRCKWSLGFLKIEGLAVHINKGPLMVKGGGLYRLYRNIP